MQRFVRLSSLVAMALLVFTSDVTAAKQVQRTVVIPAEFVATLQATGCTGSPGPRIAIQSELVASGLRADVIFSRPGGPLPEQEQFVAEQVVIPQNSEVALPPQAVVAGLGDNPFLWLQLTDVHGKPLTSEIFLGQCSQGTLSASADLQYPVDVRAELTASECSGATGPVVNVDGTAELSALSGRLIFRNTSDPIGGPGRTGEVTVDLVMLPAGPAFEFPQQIVQGQIQSDPQISLQLREAGGEPIGGEIRFGRCVAIAD